MKLVLALLLVGLASSYAQPYQSVCEPTEVVFLLDHSENARKASTLNDNVNFKLLQQAWSRYMRDLQILGDNVFRIWAWAYSSSANPVQLVPRGSRPSQSINAPIGSMESAGSWTYKGLEMIKDARPNPRKNIVIIISAQGSRNSRRRQLASGLYNVIRANGWDTYVIGVMSGSIIDLDELTIVNGNRNPVVLDDGRPTNKKSYSLLYDALSAITNNILCRQTVVTPRPTARPTPRPYITTPYVTYPPVTRPPSTGICSNCRVEGGYGFDKHDGYCDRFYQCLPSGDYVEKLCSQSTIWNDDTGSCVSTDRFQCPLGACNARLTDKTYASGVCCNMYFKCNGEFLDYIQCPKGQIYDARGSRCVPSNNPIQDCAAMNAFYCNDKIWNKPLECGEYKPDPLGNPCRYIIKDVVMATAQGTIWDQTKCALVKSDVCLLTDLASRALRNVSSICNAFLLSTFEPGDPEVQSPRVPLFTTHVERVGAIKTRGTLVFRRNVGVAYNYYYFFNNNEMTPNVAFRLVFQLDDNAQNNVEYDLFSNNYCPSCPGTYGATIRKSGSSYTITTNFVDRSNNAIVTARVDNIQNNGGWLSLIVIWGSTDVHGVVKVLSNTKQVMNEIPIPPVLHSAKATIKPNKCGIALGTGPNTVFFGRMDEFAFYSSCANIDDVLRL